MATKEELKQIIVDLKVALAQSRVPQGNCPYAYYSIEKSSPDCNSISCDKCGSDFWDNFRKIVIKEVKQL